ncbi:hypothetical protein AVBRAN12654_01795 [Campylobacter sp. RM12654]|uniref:hypothetical protein n=1 Tax=unclassified Campylobacter TaxID=2593542 RepID=UPI001BD9BD3B|nr:hypothetical protein [Campylobacter sp. 2018MI01]MBT0878753.1 hypothetical protein [Campylobacter sp. 2018MI01]MBZ7977511.1 hypothetical protein [Campylobacter sp. RM12654]
MKKSGFSMITAIIFIILVSVVGVLTLQSSKSTVSFAARAYLKEQVELIMDGARAKALSRWFESGDPRVNSGIMSNAKVTESYYYNDKKYLITIEYTKVDSSKALKFDKNTVLARISVETGEALSKVAKIRLVRDYTIGN